MLSLRLEKTVIKGFSEMKHYFASFRWYETERDLD